jgi:hypothetical protein
MANINLINSVAKAYRSMNAPLVTQAGAQALGSSIVGATSNIIKGFRKAKEASVKSQKALQKNLNYTPEDFTDLDLSDAQIEIIDNIYDEYNEGAKLATNPRKRKRDEEGGRKMMNNAKKRLDDLYDSLTKFGTTLNNVKKNVDLRSKFNDPLQTVLYDYMVNNHQDFMKRVKIDENGRAFFPMAIVDDPNTKDIIEQGNRLIYLDELEDLANEDINAGNKIHLDLYDTVYKIANRNLPLEARNQQIEARINSVFNSVQETNQKGSIIFDGIYKDDFLTFLVTDPSFKKKYPQLAAKIPKIKNGDDAEDLAAEIETELISAMKSGEYDLFNDYREFTLDKLMNTNMRNPNRPGGGGGGGKTFQQMYPLQYNAQMSIVTGLNENRGFTLNKQYYVPNKGGFSIADIQTGKPTKDAAVYTKDQIINLATLDPSVSKFLKASKPDNKDNKDNDQAQQLINKYSNNNRVTLEQIKEANPDLFKN